MDTTTQMSEADYQQFLVAAHALGQSEPGLNGPDMFVRLGLLAADHGDVFLTPVVEKLGVGRRAFAIRRAYLDISI